MIPRVDRIVVTMGAFLVVMATAWALMGCAGGRSRVAVDDKTLVVGVRTALAAFPDNSYEDVEVAARKGTVELTGVVDNAWLRYYAVGIAMNVHGVRAVLNGIHIRSDDDGNGSPAPEQDDDILARVAEPIAPPAI